MSLFQWREVKSKLFICLRLATRCFYLRVKNLEKTDAAGSETKNVTHPLPYYVSKKVLLPQSSL
jgi:hypothetical protein